MAATLCGSPEHPTPAGDRPRHLQLPPREIQHHAREPNSETGSHASTRVGRADESRFTEALGAVHEMQALQAEAGMNSAGGADRLEAALLGKLEAEADGGRRALTRTLSELGGMSLDTAAASEVSAAPPRALPATESVRSEVSESACSVQNGFEPSFELAQAVQAAPATSSAAPSLLSAVAKRVSQHRSYERIDEADGARSDALTCLHWCSAGLAQLLWRELLLSATLLPLLAVLAAQSDLPKDMRITLALPLCYSYAAARAIGVIVEAAASAVLRYRPVFEWTTLIVRGAFGWPLAAIVLVLLSSAWPALGVDVASWQLLHAIPRFWPVNSWMLLAGLSRPLVEAAVIFYINNLTLKHFEQRALEAHTAQKLLRRVVAASRAAERRAADAARQRALKSKGLKSRSAVSFGVTSNGADVSITIPQRQDSMQSASAMQEHADRWAVFFAQLKSLSGPLEFGEDLQDAVNVVQARRRAARVFGVLAQQEALLIESHGDGAPIALSRRKLLAWASGRLQTSAAMAGAAFAGAGSSKDAHARAGSSKDAFAEPVSDPLFQSNETLDEETFVSAIERTYKEQRLLTASVASFDKINGVFHKVSVAVWAITLAAVLVVVWGFDFAVWVIPSVSVIASLIVLMGRAPGDILSGALYTLLFRPFHIGDRVLISKPGFKPQLFSMIVREIDVVRTHFLTSHGELLYIENYLLRQMSIINLSRSEPTWLLIRVQAPAATPVAKMTEIADSVRLYVAEKNSDWSAVDLQYSSTDFAAGHLNLDIWAASKHAAAEVGKIYTARSGLILFIHTYMQSAGIEYVQPLIPVRITAPAMGGLPGVGLTSPDTKNDHAPHMGCNHQ